MAPQTTGVTWAFLRPILPLGSAFIIHVLSTLLDGGKALGKPHESLWGAGRCPGLILRQWDLARRATPWQYRGQQEPRMPGPIS